MVAPICVATLITTAARPGPHRRGYGRALSDHGPQWFFSVPMSDVFRRWRRRERACPGFIASGWPAGGNAHAFTIQRLKDSGQQSNACVLGRIPTISMPHARRGDRGRANPHDHRDAHVTRPRLCHRFVGSDRQRCPDYPSYTNRRAVPALAGDLPIMRMWSLILPSRRPKR